MDSRSSHWVSHLHLGTNPDAKPARPPVFAGGRVILPSFAGQRLAGGRRGRVCAAAHPQHFSALTSDRHMVLERLQPRHYARGRAS